MHSHRLMAYCRSGGQKVPDVVLENPVINSRYEEPRRHFKFDDVNITSEIVDERCADLRKRLDLRPALHLGEPLPLTRAHV